MSLTAEKLLRFALCAVILGAATRFVAAQQTTADAKGPTMAGSANLTQAQIDEIIRKFTARETKFRNALNSYAFKRDALIQEIGMGGLLSGVCVEAVDSDVKKSGAKPAVDKLGGKAQVIG